MHWTCKSEKSYTTFEEEIAASESAFHNAQAVVALFGPKNFYFSSADAYSFPRHMLRWGIATGNIQTIRSAIIPMRSMSERDKICPFSSFRLLYFVLYFFTGFL